LALSAAYPSAMDFHGSCCLMARSAAVIYRCWPSTVAVYSTSPEGALDSYRQQKRSRAQPPCSETADCLTHCRSQSVKAAQLSQLCIPGSDRQTVHVTASSDRTSCLLRC
jgi:hypothetical protein